MIETRGAHVRLLLLLPPPPPSSSSSEDDVDESSPTSRKLASPPITRIAPAASARDAASDGKAAPGAGAETGGGALQAAAVVHEWGWPLCAADGDGGSAARETCRPCSRKLSSERAAGTFDLRRAVC